MRRLGLVDDGKDSPLDENRCGLAIGAMSDRAVEQAGAVAGTVLLTLCAGQFLMALDSSVMNVSIATVADDLGTTSPGSRPPSSCTRWSWRC